MRPGEAIAGRYEILRSVRSGGLSVVFEAVDRRTAAKVAIKIINIEARDQALLRRIDREIKILTSLAHPHVVACMGSGSLPDGRPYLVLEWLDGEDLADFKVRAPLTLRRVLEVAGQVADALAAAHTLGIIHRDIKPANIYLVRPAQRTRIDCRVIDFGVAKMPQSNAAITRAGAILGTPSYMAPEQASYAMDVDARADVFSLGVVTYELLTGRLPWQSNTDLARLARIMIEPAISVHDVNPEVPNAVADLIESMLELRPSERISTARQVHDRVVAALAGLPEGVLDTTFNRDPELLKSFVREDTADLPGPDEEPTPLPAPLPKATRTGEVRISRGARQERTEISKVAKPAEKPAEKQTEKPRGKPTEKPTEKAAEKPAEKPPQRAKAHFDEQLSYVESTAGSLLFGRVQEIETLRLQVMRSLNADRPSFTLVVGPAGIGKSRVRVELTKIIRGVVKAPIVFAGRAEESSRSSPFAFIRRMLMNEAQIHSDDPPERKRQKLLVLVPGGKEILALIEEAEPPPPGIEITASSAPRPRGVTRFSSGGPPSEYISVISAIRDAFGDPEVEPSEGDEERASVAAFLAEAMQIPYPEVPPLADARSDPRLMGDQVRRAFDIVLRHLAGRSGLVVLVDDAHLLDPMSAMVLGGLMQPKRKLSIAFVAFSLPAMFEESARGGPPLAIEPTRVVELSPLDARAAREFVRSLVKGSVEPGSLELLIKRAGGIPLQIEQLVRAIQATGAVRLGEGGEYELRPLEKGETEEDRIPPTIAASVAARISRMKHDLQRVLTAAAVFGEVFWVEGVAKLLDHAVEDTTLQLDAILLEGFVRRRASSRYHGQMEMEFSHGVIRSVALARVKRKRRHKLERSALLYLESIGEADQATLAHHTAHSGRIEEAADLYGKAAEGSLRLGSLPTARQLADEGLLLTEGGSDTATRKKLLDQIERIALLESDFEGALDALDGLAQVSETLEEKARLEEGRARALFSSHRFEEAKSAAEAAIALWRKALAEPTAKAGEDPRPLPPALHEAAALLLHAEVVEALGDGRTALRGFIAAQSVFMAHDDARGLARTTRGLARIAISSGDYRTAENRFRECSIHANAIRDRESAFFAALGLAEVARLTGLGDRAKEQLDDAAQHASDQARALLLEAQRARLLAEEAEIDQALRRLDRVHAAAESDPRLAFVRRRAALYRGQLLLAPKDSLLGAKKEAPELFARLEAALKSARAEEPSLVVPLQACLAFVSALDGRLDDARSLADLAIRGFSAEGAVIEDEPPRIYLSRARVLELVGERKDRVKAAWKSAVEHLDSITSRLDRKMRKRYLDRAISQMIMKGAERAGLKLSLDASSNRVAMSDG